MYFLKFATRKSSAADVDSFFEMMGIENNHIRMGYTDYKQLYMIGGPATLILISSKLKDLDYYFSPTKALSDDTVQYLVKYIDDRMRKEISRTNDIGYVDLLFTSELQTFTVRDLLRAAVLSFEATHVIPHSYGLILLSKKGKYPRGYPIHVRSSSEAGSLSGNGLMYDPFNKRNGLRGNYVCVNDPKDDKDIEIFKELQERAHNAITSISEHEKKKIYDTNMRFNAIISEVDAVRLANTDECIRILQSKKK